MKEGRFCFIHFNVKGIPEKKNGRSFSFVKRPEKINPRGLFSGTQRIFFSGTPFIVLLREKKVIQAF